MRVESTARWVALRVAATQPSPVPVCWAISCTGTVGRTGLWTVSCFPQARIRVRAGKASIHFMGHSFTFSMGCPSASASWARLIRHSN